MRAGLARIGFDPARFAAEEVAPDRWLGRVIEQHRAQLAALGGEAEARAALERAVTLAEAEIAKLGERDTSLVGLAAPLFPLRNPGLVSIPLGFLAVILGSLCYRDRRAEELWEELYVRSNTGIGRSRGAAH